MKTIKLISAAVLCIIAAASCSKEIVNGPDTIRTTISAKLESTKTALGAKVGDEWPNYWKTGDQISVNGVASEALDSQYDGVSSAEFTFAGALTVPYCAAYPASAVSGYSNGEAILTVPAVQNYVDGSYDPAAFIMGGKSNNSSSVSLSPWVSLFHLSLSGSASVSRVKLTSLNGTALSGTFSTNFTTKNATDVSDVVEMVAATPVALPAEFFICVPSGLEGSLKVEVFDDEGGSMAKQATIKSALVAGQMYSPATLPYSPTYGPKITAEGITSSTAVICWSNSSSLEYTIGVYSDSACNTLVDSYTVPAGDTCWGSETPRFCISGLTPGTTYYVKVTDEDHSADSNILPVTTAAFDIVEVSSTPASVGDVILAEDFGELRWDSELINRGVGYFPTSQDSFANSEPDQFLPIDTNTEKVLGGQANALGTSRLAHWAQGANNNLYIHPGYIKLVGSKKVTHIVTPALDNIPDGKLAILEIEVTASAYFSESSNSFCTTNAIVAVQTDDLNELTDATKTNTLNLSSNTQGITLDAASAWKTYTATLSGVVKGNRIAFGAADGVSGNDARMLLSDIKVTIKDLYEAGDLVASLKNVSSSTASFTWGHEGEDKDFDISKSYTAAIYSDNACTNLVASYEIPDSVNTCWDNKKPAFVFSGLTPGTEYWCKITNTTDGIEANPVSCTTSPFTVVDATTVSNAGVGDVILAEDFSEIGWGSDEFGVAAGYVPHSKVLYVPSGNYTDDTGNYAVYNNTSGRLYGDTNVASDKRLYHWGFYGNSAVYGQAASLRVCTSASGARTHIVSPALVGIPAGKKATIDVTVTCGQYADNANDVAVFVESDSAMSLALAPDQKGNSDFSGKGGKYNGATLSKGYPLNAKTREWNTKTVRINGVTNDTRLLIGSYENLSGKNRFFLSDVVVTIVELKDQGAVDAVVEIKDFDSFKSFLTAAAAPENAGKAIQGNVTADLDLTTAQVEEIDALYPVSFGGIVNGNNHTISGLVKPLFDELSGSVNDLTLNSTLNITTALNNVGILAGTATDATITNCTANGSVALSYASEFPESISIGGLVGLSENSTLTSCVNNASVSNASDTHVGIFIGGLVGQSVTSTYVTCSNTGAVSNSGFAYDSLIIGDVCIGGLVGYLNGVNTLTGTDAAYNFNSGTVTENSTTGYVAMGGIAGVNYGDGSDLSYSRNLEDGDIFFTGNTRAKSYIGGIVGGFRQLANLDHTSNAGDLTFESITVSNQIFIGGILGGMNSLQDPEWYLRNATNSGAIVCENAGGDGSNMAAESSSVTSYSYVGGITGNGDNYNKYVYNCTNTGNITFYCQLKVRLGGIMGYSNKCPTGSVCNISDKILFYRYNPQGNGGNSEIGGVVGYCNIDEFEDLTFIGGVQTTGSSPNAFTAGIIGRTNKGGTFRNCKVGKNGKNIVGASSGKFVADGNSTGAGLFASAGGNYDFDFTGSIVATGTKCQGKAINDSNLENALIGRKAINTLTNPPTIGSF